MVTKVPPALLREVEQSHHQMCAELETFFKFVAHLRASGQEFSALVLEARLAPVAIGLTGLEMTLGGYEADAPAQLPLPDATERGRDDAQPHWNR